MTENNNPYYDWESEPIGRPDRRDDGTGMTAGHQIMSPSNTSEEARQLEIKPIKDPHILTKNDKDILKQIDITEFLKDTLNAIVKGKSVIVTGIKNVKDGVDKNTFSETTFSFNIPEKYDVDKVDAWFNSDNFLCIFVPLKNQPIVHE